MSTNYEREQRGAATINRYMDAEDIGPGEAAADAIADILHAYCEGDEQRAANLLGMALYHFTSESAEAPEPDPGELAESLD